MVTIKTNFGDIKIALNAEKAPKTVENFINYVKSGFYDGTIFHRVIDGFMVQGGDISCSAYPLTQSSTGCNPGTGGYSAISTASGFTSSW